MSAIKVSQTIDAPPETVFFHCSDIPHAADRVSSIERIEMLSAGPVGAGTRWKETRRMFGKEATEEMGVTEFDPPRSYTVESDSCGTHYKSVLRFVPEGSGTRVEMEFTGRPQTVMAKLSSPLAGLMSGTIKKALQRDLDELKQAIESSSAASA